MIRSDQTNNVGPGSIVKHCQTHQVLRYYHKFLGFLSSHIIPLFMVVAGFHHVKHQKFHPETHRITQQSLRKLLGDLVLHVFSTFAGDQKSSNGSTCISQISGPVNPQQDFLV